MENRKYTKSGLVFEFLKGSTHYFVISIMAAIIVTGVDMISPQLIRITVDSVLGDEQCLRIFAMVILMQQWKKLRKRLKAFQLME